MLSSRWTYFGNSIHIIPYTTDSIISPRNIGAAGIFFKVTKIVKIKIGKFFLL